MSARGLLLVATGGEVRREVRLRRGVAGCLATPPKYSGPSRLYYRGWGLQTEHVIPVAHLTPQREQHQSGLLSGSFTGACVRSRPSRLGHLESTSVGPNERGAGERAR